MAALSVVNSKEGAKKIILFFCFLFESLTESFVVGDAAGNQN